MKKFENTKENTMQKTSTESENAHDSGESVKMKNSGTKTMTNGTDNQFALERRKYIGATDIAPILGLSPWKSPRDIWLEKTNRVEVEPQVEVMRWGILLEPLVGEEWSRITGKDIERRETIVSDHVACNLDYWVPDDKCPLEIKTTTSRSGYDACDLPIHYECQIMMQMYLTKAKQCYVAMLINGSNLDKHTHKYNDQFDGLYDKLNEWWVRHVEGDVEPKSIAQDTPTKVYTQATEDKTVTADMSIQAALKVIKVENQKIKDSKKIVAEHTDLIKCALKDAEILIDDDDKVLATWKSPRDREIVNWDEFNDKVQDMFRKIGVKSPKPFDFVTTKKQSRRFLVK